MRKLLIPVSLLVAMSFSFVPVQAEDDAEWLTEDQMQKMSIAQLQEWANKTERSVKDSKTFKAKEKKSKVHMERRLGYHPQLAENSPEVPLRDELRPNTGTRPDGAISSQYPEPRYYDESAPRESGLLNNAGRILMSPLTMPLHMLHFTGKAFNKVLYFIDENFAWI
jgi:hypothetical protein